jgi:hypothetical protein
MHDGAQLLSYSQLTKTKQFKSSKIVSFLMDDVDSIPVVVGNGVIPLEVPGTLRI